MRDFYLTSLEDDFQELGLGGKSSRPFGDLKEGREDAKSRRFQEARDERDERDEDEDEDSEDELGENIAKIAENVTAICQHVRGKLEGVKSESKSLDIFDMLGEEAQAFIEGLEAGEFSVEEAESKCKAVVGDLADALDLVAEALETETVNESGTPAPKKSRVTFRK